MKKVFYELKMSIFICILGICIFSGCASYPGPLDPDVPLSESVIFQIDQSLTVTDSNGKPVKWASFWGAMGGGSNHSMLIPAGDYTLTFDYVQARQTGGGYGYRVITTTTAHGIKVSQKFIAGNTYRAVPDFLPDNKIGVRIVLMKEGEDNFKFSAPEVQFVAGLGSTSQTTFGVYVGGTFGRVYENEARRSAWNAEIGYSMGYSSKGSIGMGLDLLLGANYEFYLNRKGMGGLSVGGGMMVPFVNLIDGEGPALHPYIRVGVPFVVWNGCKAGMNLSLFLADDETLHKVGIIFYFAM